MDVDGPATVQGVVTAMCSVLPAATAIKVKSRDQAHRRATIKGSRWRSGHKYDQNQNKMPDVVCTMHTLLTLMLHRAIVVISTVLCPVARILLVSCRACSGASLSSGAMSSSRFMYMSADETDQCRPSVACDTVLS